MQFTTPLLHGKLICRYKRFLADVELDNGERVTAHCPNTGAMTGCAQPGFDVYLSTSTNPKRKLPYTWELACNGQNQFIGINTHNANSLVAEAIENNVGDAFSNVTSWKREVTPPGADSRFDFHLQTADGEAYAEVKSVTLAENGKGFFPDAKTARGRKHCETLGSLAESGIKTILVFCVQHTGVNSVQLANHIDPDYARAVLDARRKGMQVMALGCEINEQNIVINQLLPVFL